jgi:hypothetical protein
VTPASSRHWSPDESGRYAHISTQRLLSQETDRTFMPEKILDNGEASL